MKLPRDYPSSTEQEAHKRQLKVNSLPDSQRLARVPVSSSILQKECILAAATAQI